LDITKSVLRKLGKEKLPTALLPSVYPEEKPTNEPTISINSVSGCLEALTQCHSTITEQDESSSSDSDSDPEGGELPDIAYSREEPTHKKKLKKKRTEKIVEERLLKSGRKREVNPPQTIKATSISTTEESNITHDAPPRNEPPRRIRVSQPLIAEMDINLPSKLTLAVDQV
jgi:hypothetical protein